MNKHLDGSVCKGGSRQVPPHFTPCCQIFAAHIASCELDLRYEWWPDQRFWVIAIPEAAGSGGVWISHCPHCGQLLRPESERQDEDDSSGGQPGRWLQI